MRKIIDYIAIALILLLGVVHAAMTPLFYKTFDLNALWFAGAGLSFVFLGIVNISRMKSPFKTIKILCILANILALIFCILIVLKLARPQAYISLFILVLLLILSLVDIRSPQK